MDIFAVLIPTALTTIAIVISWIDISFIQAKVHNELPDDLLSIDNNDDNREALLRKGRAIAELPTLTLIQRNEIIEICRELEISTGLTRDKREHIVQMCAGAALLVAFVANIVVAIATAVFTLIALHASYWLWLAIAVVTALSVVLLGYQMWHIAARLALSQIEDYHLEIPGFTQGGQGPTWGSILRLELIVFNTLLFVELALST